MESKKGMLVLNSHLENPQKTQMRFTCSIQWSSVNQTYCVCVQGKHSDCVIFTPLTPAKTQHINYALTPQPNSRVYNSLQILSVKLTTII